MHALCFVLILAAGHMQLGRCGYIDEGLVNGVILGFQNAFQTVAQNDANNFTEIFNVINNPASSQQQILAEFNHFALQFNYTYTNFQVAIQILINTTNTGLASQPMGNNDVYIPDQYLLESIQILKNIANSLAIVLNDFSTLVQDSILLPSNFIVNSNGTATIPLDLGRSISQSFSELSKLSVLIDDFCASLSRKIYSIIKENNQFQSGPLQKITVPLTEYANIMQILSKLNKRLSNYYKNFIPTSVVTNIGVNTATINYNKEINQAAKIVSKIQKIYQVTAQANSQVLDVLHTCEKHVVLTTPKPFVQFSDPSLSISSSEAMY